MADNIENRAARLKGSKKKINLPAIIGVTLITGLVAGGGGILYLLKDDGTATIAQRDTSATTEFQKEDESTLTSVITPADPTFPVADTGPSEAERALKARLDAAEQALEAARNQIPAAAPVDTTQLETLKSQLDGLAADMAKRAAEVQTLTNERNQITRDLERAQAENSGLLTQLEQANDTSMAEQILAEEQAARQQELERRRTEAQAIEQAQINSPIDGMSGGGTESEGLNRAGFAGDLKPEKDESHGKEQDGQPLFTGGSRPRGADGAGTPEFL